MLIKANPKVIFSQEGNVIDIAVNLFGCMYTYGYIEENTVHINDSVCAYYNLKTALDRAEEEVKKLFSSLEIEIEVRKDTIYIMIPQFRDNDTYQVSKISYSELADCFVGSQTGNHDNLLDAFNAELDEVLTELAGE